MTADRPATERERAEQIAFQLRVIAGGWQGHFSDELVAMLREAADLLSSLPPVRAQEPADYKAGKAYLTRLLKSLSPQCEPLPDLLGLATQIDNYIAGLPPAYLAALPPVQEPPNPDNWFDRQADGAVKAYEELPKWLKPDASPSQGVRLDDLKALSNAIDYACSIHGGWDREHERYLDSLIESLHEVVEDVSDNEHAAAALRQGTEAVLTLRRARDDARKAIIELSKLSAALEGAATKGQDQ